MASAMDPENGKFGRGPRELTGAADLISHYRLQTHHDFFCKKLLPVAVVDTHYLHNVVGDVEIRKGEGMELDQLFRNPQYLREMKSHIEPFDLDALTLAFQLRESTPVELSSADKGAPTISGKCRDETKDKDKKHKRHKDKDGKDKDHKKHKHRHKDRSKVKDKDRDKKDRNGHFDSTGSHSNKHNDKKRKHEWNEVTNTQKHKKSKLKG